MYRFGDLPPEHVEAVRRGLGRIGLESWLPHPAFEFDGMTDCPEHDPLTGAMMTGPGGVHDLAYTLGSIVPDTAGGRALADAVLYHLLLWVGASETTAEAIHTAVRLGAASHFKRK